MLAVLLLDLGRVVPTELLIDRVWGEDPPDSVRNVLYGYVARLRAVIAGAADPQVTLARRQGGYLLQASDEQLDVRRFRRLVSDATAAGDERAAALLRQALGLWRGPALAGLDSLWLGGMRDVLEAERITAVLDLNDIRLRQGEHRALAGELTRQSAASPADERLTGQLMLALYRSGRQAEALRWFEQTRQRLASELGADPGPGLRALHEQILRGDPALAAPAGAPAAAAVRRAGAEPGPPDEIFVGRSGELTTLSAAVAAAADGQPTVVLVDGEAGIGKTALLSRFASGMTGAAVLRASGDEGERLLPYGIVGQLTASAGDGDMLPGLLAPGLTDVVDPLVVGGELVTWFGRLCAGHELVLGIVDDLQWADGPSARALLFAVRRLRAARVLIVASARAAELARLGNGWQRFLAGDRRVVRVRLGGFTAAEVLELGRALGQGELAHPTVRRLLAETSGHPLYCRAVLEEGGTGDWRVPRSLAGVVLSRVRALSPAARELITALAVLGTRCGLPVAARLAELADPVPALEEAVTAGILAELPGAAGTSIGFSHLLVRRAVYGDLSPQRRRGLHLRAAGLVDRAAALTHRVAAAAGPDDQLASELEAAGQEDFRLGRLARAAAWLAQAAEVSTAQEAADRRCLDALEILVNFGELADAESLIARVEAIKPSARRSWLLGTVDFLAGRMADAEARLADAWRAHDHDRDAAAGCAAAMRLAIGCASAGRSREAVEWGERAVAAAPDTAWQHAAAGVLAIGLCRGGRAAEAMDRLAIFGAAATEVALADTDTLVLRGIARSLADDLPGAVADLSVATARLRAGVPLRTASWCLQFMASAEYRYGSWDDAVLDAEMAVSFAGDADRAWELGFAHSLAAVVPAQRGEWDTAAAHVRMAREGAHANGDIGAMGAASTAREYLAMAQGDLEGVLAAAAATRASGNKEFYFLADNYDWRLLEIEALVRLGRLSQAETALAAMETDLSVFGPPAAKAGTARLRAELALATMDFAAATAATADAWRHARDLQAPLLLAQLEITEARRLRGAGQPAAAAARLTSARQRLSRLGATPYLRACDGELAAVTATPVG